MGCGRCRCLTTCPPARRSVSLDKSAPELGGTEACPTSETSAPARVVRSETCELFGLDVGTGKACQPTPDESGPITCKPVEDLLDLDSPVEPSGSRAPELEDLLM